LVATEDSTKLISRLENQIKRYIFTVDISIFTPSFDLDIKNEPIQCDLSNLIDHSIEELQEFIGSQTTQIPPKYSAIHIE
jgi:tRNA U55 pseudouridine synthase TruB